MDDFRLIAALGIFHVPEGATAPVCFPDGEPAIELLPGLESMEGREVEVVAHYLPDADTAKNVRGLGSCLMGDHCAAGHMHTPNWLLNYHERGVLRREGFAWFVGDSRIPLGLLPGHRGRFVATTTEEVKVEGVPDLGSEGVPDQETQDILKEAKELEALLQGLQSIVRGGG